MYTFVCENSQNLETVIFGDKGQLFCPVAFLTFISNYQFPWSWWEGLLWHRIFCFLLVMIIQSPLAQVTLDQHRILASMILAKPLKKCQILRLLMLGRVLPSHHHWCFTIASILLIMVYCCLLASVPWAPFIKIRLSCPESFKNKHFPHKVSKKSIDQEKLFNLKLLWRIFSIAVELMEVIDGYCRTRDVE